MAHKISDVVFQVTHTPIHLTAYPIARDNCNTTSTETFCYFYPVVIPLLSSYNFFYIFYFTEAIHTWNPNKENPCTPPCPQTCESEGRWHHGVWKNEILHPAAFSPQQEGDPPSPVLSPGSMKDNTQPF